MRINRYLPVFMLAFCFAAQDTRDLAAAARDGEKGVVKASPGPARAESQTMQQAAFVFSRDEDIYYRPAGDKQPRKLTRGRFPSLSPDGARVAYGREREGGWSAGLYVLDLSAGKDIVLIDAKSEPTSNPVWSPDGKLVAFLSSGERTNTINTIGAGGENRRKLYVSTERLLDAPIWATDGRSLYFHDLDHLYQVDLAGRLVGKTPLSDFTGRKAAVSSGDLFIPNPVMPHIWAFTMAVPGTKKFDLTFGEPNTALFLFR